MLKRMGTPFLVLASNLRAVEFLKQMHVPCSITIAYTIHLVCILYAHKWRDMLKRLGRFVGLGRIQPQVSIMVEVRAFQ